MVSGLWSNTYSASQPTVSGVTFGSENQFPAALKPDASVSVGQVRCCSFMHLNRAHPTLDLLRLGNLAALQVINSLALYCRSASGRAAGQH